MDLATGVTRVEWSGGDSRVVSLAFANQVMVRLMVKYLCQPRPVLQQQRVMSEVPL